ncbi:MAG: hypothetical protein ACYYKD_13865 [Rhodospirillales bacterium]
MNTPPFDPADHRSAESVADEHESGLGYGPWAERCAAVFSREPGEGGAFERDGFEYLPVFSPAAARSMILQFEKLIQNRDASAYNDGPGFTRVKINKPEIPRMLIQRILNAAADARLTSFFQSEYRVMFLTVVKTEPSEESNESFLWHKDAGPRKHAKIILYLTDAVETGGRTDFIDAAATARIAAAGYDFVRTNLRIGDLSAFSAEQGLQFDISSNPPAAGESVIFKPFHVLHKGIGPARGPRWTVTLILTPHDEPWRKDIEHRNLLKLQETESADWENKTPLSVSAP